MEVVCNQIDIYMIWAEISQSGPLGASENSLSQGLRVPWYLLVRRGWQSDFYMTALKKNTLFPAKAKILPNHRLNDKVFGVRRDLGNHLCKWHRDWGGPELGTDQSPRRSLLNPFTNYFTGKRNILNREKSRGVWLKLSRFSVPS